MSTDEPQEAKEPNVYEVVSEMERAAALQDHINKTMAAAMDALRHGQRNVTLEILQNASAKYVRLGGEVSE